MTGQICLLHGPNTNMGFARFIILYSLHSNTAFSFRRVLNKPHIGIQVYVFPQTAPNAV